MATNTANPPAARPTLNLPSVGSTPERFWVGVTEDAPFHSVPICGVKFQKDSYALVRDDAGNVRDDPRTGFPMADNGLGGIHTISAEAMVEIGKSVEVRVCGWVSLPDRVDAFGKVLEPNRKRSRRQRKFNPDGKGGLVPNPTYQPSKNEEPIGRYLFILPESERAKYGRGARPPTLLPR